MFRYPGGGRYFIFGVGVGGRGGVANSQRNRGTGAWHSDLPPKFQRI